MRLAKHLYIVDSCRRRYLSLTEQAPGLSQLVKKGTKTLAIFPFIAEDIFTVLHDKQVLQYEAKERSLCTEAHRWVCDGLMEAPEFTKLKHLCQGDFLNASLAVCYFLEELLNRMETEFIDLVNVLHKCEGFWYKSQVEAQAAEKVVEILNSMGQNTLALTYSRKVRYLWVQARKWEFKVHEAFANLMEYYRQQQPRIDGRTYQLQARVTHRLEHTNQVTRNCLEHLGKWQNSFQQTAQLVEAVIQSPKLLRILERLNRLQDHAGGGITIKDRPSGGQFCWGSDLSRVLPEELVLQSINPPLFYRRFIEEKLWMIQEDETTEGGPLIVCLDCSGSMQGPKEEIAKAITLGVTQLALEKERLVVALLFGGVRDDMKIISFHPESLVIDQFADICNSLLRSPQTDYTKPLSVAVDFLRQSRYSGGNILLITDGLAETSQEFLREFQKAKANLGFRTISLLINYGFTDTKGVADISDEVLISSDYTGLDVAGPLMQKYTM